MNELDAILAIRQAEPEAVRQAILTTVVHVKGSAYRRPGARMLILPDGRRIGTVSGGCLETAVSSKAWWFTEGGRPAVRAYDTSSDEDAVWEFGLGCNGVVHVLFERAGSVETGETLAFLASHRHGATVATVVGGNEGIGRRLLIDSGGAVCGGSLQGSSLAGEILSLAAARRSRLADLTDCEVFLEWIAPPVPLVIFGAGHDALPLVRLAKELGWHVTVADGRPQYLSAARFPLADRLVHLGPQDVMGEVPITPESVVVLLTHNYPMDVKLARHILPCQPRYLGLLGPKSRSERLLEELEARSSANIHAPAGLDVGADTPEAIALSIVAEIQAVLSGRDGGMLKCREGSIHAPVEEVGELPQAEPPASEHAFCELS